MHRPVQLAALYSTPRDELLATARHAGASRAAFIWELWSIGLVMVPENKISYLAKGALLSLRGGVFLNVFLMRIWTIAIKIINGNGQRCEKELTKKFLRLQGVIFFLLLTAED